MTTQTILDQLLLVVLNISFWNGRKALSTSELAASGIDADNLPQGTIAALESKQILPPETVKVFAALKREAMGLCLNGGIRFGWGEGYAIPRDNHTELLQELKRVKDEFEAAKANFLSQYEREIKKWLASHSPKQIPVIRSLIQSASYIHDAICFNYAAFEAKVPAGIGNNGINGIDDEVNGLFVLLCQDIRMTAARTYEYYFAGREGITRKTLRPIKAMRNKLAGLQFLDASVAETVQFIDDTLNGLPKYGAITGDDLAMVFALLEKQLGAMGLIIPDQYDVAQESEVTLPHITITENTGKVAPIAWDF